MTSPLTILTQAVAELGGPLIDTNDIEWVLQLPAGAQIVDWLTEQCVVPGNVESGKLEREIGVALRSIALEHDEMNILAPKDHEIQPQVNALSTYGRYEPPTHLRKHAGYIDQDTRFVETAKTTVESRLKQTKRAIQTNQSTISSLHAAIQRQDAGISRAQERLAELSILADSTMKSGADAALTLLDTLSCSGGIEAQEENRPSSSKYSSCLQSSMRSLTELARVRASLVDEVEMKRASLPPKPRKETIEDSKYFFQALEGLLEDDQLLESAYAHELRKLHESLSQGKSVSNVMSCQGPEPDGDPRLDIRSLVENAWATDQASQLDSEHAILTSAINNYETVLLPALNALYSQLSARQEAVRSAEALIGALGVEIEGISNLLSDDALHASQDADPASTNDTSFEQQIRALLEEDSPGDDGKTKDKPMEKGVVLAELRRLQKFLDDIETTEMSSDLHNIKEKLGLMSHSSQPLLAALYESSSIGTNTTLPFQRSSTGRDITQKAQKAVTRLEDSVRKAEELETFMLDKRSQRKLREFVERSLLDVE